MDFSSTFYAVNIHILLNLTAVEGQPNFGGMDPEFPVGWTSMCNSFKSTNSVLTIQ